MHVRAVLVRHGHGPGETGRDYLRFISEYFGRPWRQVIADRPRFFRRIVRRAVKVYRSVHETDPQLPASLASYA